VIDSKNARWKPEIKIYALLFPLDVVENTLSEGCQAGECNLHGTFQGKKFIQEVWV